VDWRWTSGLRVSHAGTSVRAEECAVIVGTADENKTSTYRVSKPDGGDASQFWRRQVRWCRHNGGDAVLSGKVLRMKWWGPLLFQTTTTRPPHGAKPGMAGDVYLRSDVTDRATYKGRYHNAYFGVSAMNMSCPPTCGISFRKATPALDRSAQTLRRAVSRVTENFCWARLALRSFSGMGGWGVGGGGWGGRGGVADG